LPDDSSTFKFAGIKESGTNVD